MIDSENKPYFTSFSAEYLALTPDDKDIGELEGLPFNIMGCGGSLSNIV